MWDIYGAGNGIAEYIMPTPSRSSREANGLTHEQRANAAAKAVEQVAMTLDADR